MSVVLSARTPAQIASDINSIKRRTDKIMLENYVQIGRCLTEAQATVPYGEWSKWLKRGQLFPADSLLFDEDLPGIRAKLASLDGGLSEVVHRVHNWVFPRLSSSWRFRPRNGINLWPAMMLKI